MKKVSRVFITYILIFAIVISAAYIFKDLGNAGRVKEVKFSTLSKHLAAGKYTELNITDRKISAKLDNKKNGGKVEFAYAPSALEINWLEDNYVYPQVKKGKLKLESDPPESKFSLLNMLPTFIMVGMVIFLIYFMMTQGGNGKAFQFGKNKAKMYKDNGKSITFKDVAGLKEEKEELKEIVDFLKNPIKYTKLGARIPKGVLMVGSPGTGKTYISKATAGEAGVPFFTISGSDFVEMFVGVGASRVRDLFEQAKKNAPCIIFIDEIDAVGRKRGAGLGGGNDEREQTLNQLLVEMDGFDGNSGIIILAATNRPDVLDPALLRPGRFDRQIVIGMPDIKAREEIFKVHTKNKPLAEDVSPEILAKRTPGFSPADIENLVNEAALLTARRNGKMIRMDEIEEATTKVMAGPQKKSRVISEEERRLTAYHEAGHAIVMRSLPGSDPVHQITIIPRGMAGGFTMSLPLEDKFFETRGNMLNDIKHLLGGRVAEELKLDDISTGASNDLERSTAIARAMITKYGFSKKLGPVSFSSNDEVFLGRDFSTKQNYSEEISSEIDKEIKKILEESYAETKKILIENDERLENVAKALLLVETLDGEQFERLYNMEITPDELALEVKMAEDEIKRLNEEEAKQSKKEDEERLRAAEAKLKEMQEAIDKLNGFNQKEESIEPEESEELDEPEELEESENFEESENSEESKNAEETEEFEKSRKEERENL